MKRVGERIIKYYGFADTGALDADAAAAAYGTPDGDLNAAFVDAESLDADRCSRIIAR
jgi:hypothetical protein